VALPRTAIGAGIGTALGAGAGAISVKKNPDGSSTTGKRLRRAAVGGILGGAIGFVAHGASRTARMAPNLMPTGANREAYREVAHAIKGAPNVEQAVKDRSLNDVRKAHSTVERLREGFLGKHKASETLAHLRKENPFQGMSPQEAKKAYRTQALKHHPDRGGSRQAFQRLSDQYKMHQDFHPKTGSIALDGTQWDFFFDEIAKLANLSKNPASSNSIKQSVKGSKLKATSPSSPGIMPMGQTASTASTSPLPKPAQS
jgi:hypothetical protein